MAVQRIAVRDLNQHIVCALCFGYYIDPATITECLHSFCKTCLIKYVEKEKYCPMPECETLIHKTNPLFGIRSDKTLQDIVYKLVPGLHKDEMLRRQNFFRNYPPKDEQFSSFKEEKEKIFFSEDDEFSISIQYFESNDVVSDHKNGVGKCKDNRNKRYLECPGMLKMKHLKKFIVKKYGLNGEEFLVEVIYRDEIIPEEYSVIDVAYLHNYRKDRPMQFFYRIFRKNKVLLRKRKIPIMSSQGKVDSLNSPLSSLAPPTTTTTSSSSSSTNSGIGSGGESSKAIAGSSAKRIKMDVSDGNGTGRGGGGSGVAGSAAVSSAIEKCRRENQALPMRVTGAERSQGQSQLRHQRQEPKSPKKADFPLSKQGPFSDNRPRVANCGRQIAPQVLPSTPPSQQTPPPPPRRHETINVTAKDVKQILEELREKTAAAAEAAAAAKVDEDRRRPSGNVATSNHQRKRPQTTQAASANSATSKISQEQKLAIRNFRLGGGQQVQPSTGTSAASASLQGDSEKILSIVSNLHKKQVAKQQQQNLCDSVPRTVGGGAHSGLSPKTTIQKTTVSSIQFGTMKHPLSAPSVKTSDTISPRVNKAASLVVQQQQQPASAVSAMERHLAKTLPSGTAVTVKMAAAAAAAAARAAGATSNDKPYNNRDGIITPIIKKDAMSGGARTDSVRKSLSDRSFINVSEALMKQKTVLSCAAAGSGGGGGGMHGQQPMPMPRPTMSAMFKTAVAANVVRGNGTPAPRTSGVASQPTAVAPSPTTAMRNQFPAPGSATAPPTTTTNAATVAAAFPSLSATAAVAANSQSPQLAAMTAAAAVAVANLEAVSTSDSLAIQTQIPKNRLEVKLQRPSVPHNAVLNASSGVLAQPQQIISFRKQPPVAELLWSGPPVTTAAAANIVHKDASGGSGVGPRKTLNQGIRQIPNPSLLTNKQKNGTGTGDIPRTTE